MLRHVAQRAVRQAMPRNDGMNRQDSAAPAAEAAARNRGQKLRLRSMVRDRRFRLRMRGKCVPDVAQNSLRIRRRWEGHKQPSCQHLGGPMAPVEHARYALKISLRGLSCAVSLGKGLGHGLSAAGGQAGAPGTGSAGAPYAKGAPVLQLFLKESPARRGWIPACWRRVVSYGMTKEPTVSASARSRSPLPDGTGLRIVSLRPAGSSKTMAFTELLSDLRQPGGSGAGRPLRPPYLPPGATINRFAMRQPSGWPGGRSSSFQAAAAPMNFLPQAAGSGAGKAAGQSLSAPACFPIPPVGHKELLVSIRRTRERRGPTASTCGFAAAKASTSASSSRL